LEGGQGVSDGIIGDPTGRFLYQQMLNQQVDLPPSPELWKNADESQ